MTHVKVFLGAETRKQEILLHNPSRQWFYHSVNYSGLQRLAGSLFTPIHSIHPSFFATQTGRIRTVQSVHIQAGPMVWHFPQEREMKKNPFPQVRLNLVLLLPWWMLSPQAIMKNMGNATRSVFSTVLEISQPGQPGSHTMLRVSLCLPLRLLKAWSLNLLSTSTNTNSFCKHFGNSADQSERACRVKWVFI